MDVAHQVAQQRKSAPGTRSSNLAPARADQRDIMRNILRAPATVQTKLRVGAPDDPFEQEADRVAEQVMRMPAPSPSAPVVQRKCSQCAEEEVVQRDSDEPASNVSPEALASVDSVRSQAGQPLPTSIRKFFEPRFGADFSAVRVHTHPAAAQSASALHARAYTLGSDIVFGAGEWSPEGDDGKQLLAHELTHVIQQGAAGSGSGPVDSPSIQRRVIRSNVSCEATGLTAPNLTGDQVVAAIEAADLDAIALAQSAENALRTNLAGVRGGGAVNAAFDTILTEELNLTLTNPAHFRIIEQQADRYQRVRTLLESGFLRYLCRGGTTVNLVGCTAGTCTGNFALTCPANRLMVLCQAFWDTPAERGPTVLHEPFHILFSMLTHANNIPRRADSFCFESFALRVAGRPAPASCVGHTAG
jgi:hypothetical protein